MNALNRVVYLSDPDALSEAHGVRFRLTYEGPLLATQGDPWRGQPPARATHKQRLRKTFHSQLKELWRTNRFLRESKLPVDFPASIEENPGAPGGRIHRPAHKRDLPMTDVLASRFQLNGYKFVPLVRDELYVLCSLEILFLRRDIPGAVIQGGDLDNRIKTLIDGLTMPVDALQLGDYKTPDITEEPFFCLLQTDKLVTQFSVETDTLLDAPSEDASAVRLVITADVRPYQTTWFNLNFI
jgi:hypothetical protein